MKRKKIISSIIAISMLLPMAACSGKKTETPQIDGYNLLWSDEFDGRKMDETKWNYEPHQPGWTNNELQEYTTSTDNVFVRDGKLVIKAIKTTKDGKDYYTSGKVTGQNKTDFQYGKVVVSAKVPEGQGLWPAIWMMPQNETVYGQWPKCGEIDIMEYYLTGKEDVPTILANVAWGNMRGAEWRTTHHPLSKFLEADPDWVEKYHIWTMDWTPEKIVLLLDGEVMNTVDLSETVNTGFRANGENPFSNDYPDFADYILLDHAIGQNGGDPSDTEFPQRYCIDYVRVYQNE